MAGRNQTFYELRERFEKFAYKSDKQACPICQLTIEDVQRYMNLLSYENVTNPAERFKLRDAGGFCNKHTWQWFSLNDALGTALIYGDVTKMVQAKLAAKAFNQNKPDGNTNGSFWKKLKAANLINNLENVGPERNDAPGTVRRENLGLKHCPACQIQDATQLRILEEFADGLSDPKFRQAYLTSAGICLPHLAGAQDLLDSESSQFLHQVEIAKWAELQSELDLMVDRLNFDAKRGPQVVGDEKFAVRQVLWKSSGLQAL
jgi:hypothetical protein